MTVQTGSLVGRAECDRQQNYRQRQQTRQDRAPVPAGVEQRADTESCGRAPDVEGRLSQSGVTSQQSPTDQQQRQPVQHQMEDQNDQKKSGPQDQCRCQAIAEEQLL